MASGDPTHVIPRLFVFGPAAEAVHEERSES
jgi:hypothetical protein